MAKLPAEQNCRVPSCYLIQKEFPVSCDEIAERTAYESVNFNEEEMHAEPASPPGLFFAAFFY